MATYDDLRTYFQESSDLREAATRASEVPIVTGFTLDVDPLWMLLYDAQEGLTGKQDAKELYHWIRYADNIRYVDDPHFGPWPLWNISWTHAAERNPRYQGFRNRDLYRRVPEWENLQGLWKDRYGSERRPVVMTIVYRPLGPPVIDAEPVGEDDQSHLRRLHAIVAEAHSFIRTEERPRASLAFAAGDGIQTNAGRSGTLGGVLKEKGSVGLFGITCAHVATQGNLVSDDNGTFLGRCIQDTPLAVVPAGCSLDPMSYPLPQPYPSNGPYINMLDCALVELSAAPPPTMPAVSGIAAQLSTGQAVTVTGAQTSVRCILGSLAISYSFRSAQCDYYFRDAIELIPQSRLPIGGRLGQLTATCPMRGDSGAWILTDDTSPIWAGMLFGEDGNRGFAVRASWIHAWAENSTTKALTL